MPALPLYWITPFILMLLSIAVLPLFVPHFWEKNRNKAFLALVLSAPVGVYFFLHHPEALIHSLHEYVSFIALMAALFIISGGIHLQGDLKATPWTNTTFLAIGAVLANIIGTTGASMLLIRPLLNTNRERQNVNHIPIFFIFIVSNVGGLLTPIGDPPLFLGYLRGIPFFWTTVNLIPEWLTCVGLLLILFFFWDSMAYKKETPERLRRDDNALQPLKILGGFNAVFLLGVVGSVFLPTPWREIVMIVMAGLSLKLTSRSIREKNRFTFHPIVEVAVLFIGIFITMVPALELLNMRGPELGIQSPLQFFWLTGILSSFLDNAPTYLTFFTLAQGLHLPGSDIVGIHHTILSALSCGAVFMGANTYIGNGPNFMVKAIADETGFKTPSFFGYMAYSGAILIPLFVVVSLIFFM